MEQALLKPNVLWAQRNEMILLRIKMEPLEVDIKNLTSRSVKHIWSLKGWVTVDLAGICMAFNWCFMSQWILKVRFMEHEVEFRIKKSLPGKWPRLQSDHTKPHWIKVDFDHFEVSDSEDEKSQDDIVVTPEMGELEKKLMEDVQKYESMIDVISYIKRGYLVLYNLIQWVGFTVLIGILFYILKDGTAGLSNAYERGFPVISTFQLLACLEILHNLLGLVKGGVGPSFMQVGGRLFILFLCLSPVESIHTHPVVYCLFLVYSLIEVVRYPYYVASALNMNIQWLSWLRYSVWIPLYPLGFACEGITIWLSLQHGQPGGVWSYSLPNPLNISFSVSGLQKIVLITMPLSFYTLYSYMVSQRRSKLSTKKSKEKKQ